MTVILPFMDPAARAALDRLIEVARGDTHQCRYTANFLLAWWNAGDLGGSTLQTYGAWTRPFERT